MNDSIKGTDYYSLTRYNQNIQLLIPFDFGAKSKVFNKSFYIEQKALEF